MPGSMRTGPRMTSSSSSTSNYLQLVLGYFRDPKVAWVQAPSLYGNLQNWVARGAAEQELVLQGPLQRGFYGASETPFIIGSHCTYRTSAICEIGGFQPTRAEDHLDTVILAARGYRGVFVDQVLAVGQGPDSFDTYLRQQFAWAYSMIQVMLYYTPRLVRYYRPIQAIQFLFAQTWYTCWSTSMLMLFLTPLLVLVTESRPSGTALSDFVLASLPMTLSSVAIWWWSRRWQLPPGLGLSWRGVILHVARWPIVCWAFLNVLLRITHPYMITPKGNSDHLPPFTLRGQAVYLALVWLSGATIWFYLARDSEPEIQGYLLFALVGLVLMLTVVAANVALDFAQVRRRGIGLLRAARLRSAPLGALLATVVFAGITTGASRAEIVMAATWVSDPAVESGSAAHAHEILRRAAAGETVEAAPPSGGTPDPLDSSRGDLAQAEPTANGVPNTSSPRLQAAAAAQPIATPLDLPPNRVAIGAYDPNLRYTSLPIEFNQWFVRQDEPDLLAGALAIGRYRRTVFVTVEPFPSRGQREPPLDTVAAGRADEQLRRLARVVRDAEPQVVLLRWGHEMELSGLYPWAANTPDLYRSAYRRVVSVFRDEGARNARWVWSPAGNANDASRSFRNSKFGLRNSVRLAPMGLSGFVMANGSMSSNQSGEGEIRKAIGDSRAEL